MSKYNFEELKIKFGNNSFVDNLEKYIKDDEALKELRWFQIQKKKLNKEKNKDNYFFEHESNEKCKITLTNPKHFFVMNMKKEGEEFGIKPVNWPNFIKAKFIGSVIVGGKKINQKFKIVEVELENEELDKLEDLCFGEDDIFKTLNNVRKNSIWFKE